jgi:hypothetical protein
MTSAPDWLGFAARRSAERSFTLGSLLREFSQVEKLSREQLASLLSCDVDTLDWLSLCYSPLPERFGEDVSRIAERFQIDPTQLAQIIRRAQVIAAVRCSVRTQDNTLLLAARDRDEEPKKE